MARLRDKTVAYVLISTEVGMVQSVASAVANMDPVYRAIVLTGPYDVLADVWVANNHELGTVVLQIHQIDGVIDTQTSVVTWAFGDGGKQIDAVTNGPPF